MQYIKHVGYCGRDDNGQFLKHYGKKGMKWAPEKRKYLSDKQREDEYEKARKVLQDRMRTTAKYRMKPIIEESTNSRNIRAKETIKNASTKIEGARRDIDILGHKTIKNTTDNMNPKAKADRVFGLAGIGTVRADTAKMKSANALLSVHGTMAQMNKKTSGDSRYRITRFGKIGRGYYASPILTEYGSSGQARAGDAQNRARTLSDIKRKKNISDYINNKKKKNKMMMKNALSGKKKLYNNW